MAHEFHSPSLWSGFAAVLSALLLASGSGLGRQRRLTRPFADRARRSVGPEIQTHVVSIYGTGSRRCDRANGSSFSTIPPIPSHGRAVLVTNGQIVKTYPANGGVVYRSDLTFDPSRLTPEGPALAATQAYAAKHGHGLRFRARAAQADQR